MSQGWTSSHASIHASGKMDDIRHQVIELLADLRNYPSDEIDLVTSIIDDLGVAGDDADDLFLAFDEDSEQIPADWIIKSTSEVRECGHGRQRWPCGSLFGDYCA